MPSQAWAVVVRDHDRITTYGPFTAEHAIEQGLAAQKRLGDFWADAEVEVHVKVLDPAEELACLLDSYDESRKEIETTEPPNN